jgi:DNA-binding transcriptional LysR family regulator
MARNVDTALLRTFAVVADTGGMTKAAVVLNLTQAAVSQQVKRLEDTLGCQLFERDRRGFRLTSSGERLLARARRLIAANDELWATMTAPEFEGTVRLGVPSDLVRPHVPAFLKRFYQEFPRVQVVISCDTSGRLLERLDDGEFDVILTGENGCGPRGEQLFANPVVWAGLRGGHAWERSPLPISSGDDSCTFRPVALKALDESGRDWRSVCAVSSLEPILAMVEADLSVAPLYANCLAPGMEILGPDRGLPVLPVFSVNLYLPKSGTSALGAELARHIRLHLKSPVIKAQSMAG